MSHNFDFLLLLKSTVSVFEKFCPKIIWQWILIKVVSNNERFSHIAAKFLETTSIDVKTFYYFFRKNKKFNTNCRYHHLHPLPQQWHLGQQLLILGVLHPPNIGHFIINLLEDQQTLQLQLIYQDWIIIHGNNFKTNNTTCNVLCWKINTVIIMQVYNASTRPLKIWTF